MTNIAVRGTVLRSPADGSRVITFRASTPRVDRHGTKIVSTGIDTREYDKNPLFAWGHDATGGGIFGSPPDMDHVIGRVVSHNKSQQAFDIDVEFVPAEVNPKAERAFQLVKKGFLNAVSIGFIPTKWHDEGEEVGKMPTRIYDEVQLLEISLVPVPSNADCVALARSYYGDRASGMNFDLDELEAMETILRAGAVLNRQNKAKLTQAAALVNEVLATAAKEEETQEKSGLPPSPDGGVIPDPTHTDLKPHEVSREASVDDDEEDDKPGVYIARSVHIDDAKKLADWAKRNGIDDHLTPEDMHVTVVASRVHFEMDEDAEPELKVKVKGIKKLKDAIVLTLDAPKIVDRHKAARDAGATHDFKSFQPHITLSYAGGDLPDTFPGMSVRLGAEYRREFQDDPVTKSAPPATTAADIGAATQVAIRAYLDRMAIQEGIKRALKAA